MRKKEISMIILAGGASSRMGRDKSDLTIDGKTFLEMQIEKGEKLGISDILLSGYHGENKYKYPIIPDRFPGKGPLGGLEACFRKAKNPYCLVLGVDVPLVPAEELTALIRQSLHSDAKAVILSHGGHEEPLMGVYCTDLRGLMRGGCTDSELKKAIYQVIWNKPVSHNFYEAKTEQDEIRGMSQIGG